MWNHKLVVYKQEKVYFFHYFLEDLRKSTIFQYVIHYRLFQNVNVQRATIRKLKS